MNPAALIGSIPSADALPLAAPAALFHALLILTSVLHLVAMNLLLGGTVLAIVARVNGRRSDPHLQLARRIARVLPTTVAATVTLGVAPLLFLQVLYGRLFYVSSILLGWWWLAIVPVLIAMYYGAYAVAQRDRGWLPLAAIAGALLSIGLMLSLNMSLMLWPSRFVERYLADPGGLRLDVVDRAAIVRWLHFMVAAVAVAGAALAAWSWRTRGSDPAAATGLRLGLRSFAVASAVNAVVGLTWLGLLPVEALRALAGGAAGSAVVVAAIALGISTIWIAFITATTGVERLAARQVLTGAALLGATVVAMVLLRDRLRTVMVAPSGYTVPGAQPQWDVVALFALCLAAAIVTIGWMVRQYALAVPKNRQSARAAV